MHYSKKGLIIGLMIWFNYSSQAQSVNDNLQVEEQHLITVPFKLSEPNKKATPRFLNNSLLLPGFMIIYGISSIEVEMLEGVNLNLNKEIVVEKPHNKVSIDNYLQFAPAAAVYGLNAMGIKGKNNFRDRTGIYLMSNIFLNAAVFTGKKISHQLRPDGSGFNSFPSGHTAEAFASAEFFRQEYKDVSPWYGYAGYALATATGYLRMYNNKHWLGDVVAGAGVGILSTKLAYWLYPKIQQKLFKSKNPDTVVMPAYENKTIGFSLGHKF